MEKTTIVMLLTLGLMLVGGVFLYQDNSQVNNEPIRNYPFDLAVGNVVAPRLPTQHDVFVGIIQDNQGNQYKVYESKTLTKFDYSKLFIGGRV